MRPMRRESHRMEPAACEALLGRAEVLRLGLYDADGPYVVPVNFGYRDGMLYVHGPLEGRRIDAVAGDARVCFEVDEGKIIRGDTPCAFTSSFSSVIGYGTARLLTDADAKRSGLDAIMRHYGSTGEGIPDAKLHITSVVQIEIESMDGKRYPSASSTEGT